MGWQYSSISDPVCTQLQMARYGTSLDSTLVDNDVIELTDNRIGGGDLFDFFGSSSDGEQHNNLLETNMSSETSLTQEVETSDNGSSEPRTSMMNSAPKEAQSGTRNQDSQSSEAKQWQPKIRAQVRETGNDSMKYY